MGAGWQRWWDAGRYERECAEADKVRNDDPIFLPMVCYAPGWNARIVVDEVPDIEKALTDAWEHLKAQQEKPWIEYVPRSEWEARFGACDREHITNIDAWIHEHQRYDGRRERWWISSSDLANSDIDADQLRRKGWIYSQEIDGMEYDRGF